MMAMTTRNSISVKPGRFDRTWFDLHRWPPLLGFSGKDHWCPALAGRFRRDDGRVGPPRSGCGVATAVGSALIVPVSGSWQPARTAARASDRPTSIECVSQFHENILDLMIFLVYLPAS